MIWLVQKNVVPLHYEENNAHCTCIFLHINSYDVKTRKDRYLAPDRDV